ncbi:Gfo/Idh/MocA family protein [Mongoliitalea lutea]|uniref:Myo-inositol 2-dehydrogenase n=1 Tax=Mongoliitalea lutea TaxID=849756 RepID=A0A8J3D0Y8_9BACT|nr:Gfo/Idh/MocA family oxidoreductase [Mongoliitalea lutea]GHB49709.1 myo-inositol 2-dehydrogenase [Mongoliitalea lutea]
MKKIRVLVVGCGNMGASHALAYHKMEEFEICGLVARGESKLNLNQKLGGQYPTYDDFYLALKESQAEAVCISTYPDTHEEYALAALEAGCHLFVEKPLAATTEGTERIIAASNKAKRKVVVGYILRHHPSWERFIIEAQKLGKPLVMRMNLNQQSQGFMWDVHKNLMQSLSPIVDCGVHYIDVMCQMTRSKPVSVSAIGARLSDEIPKENYNYGQLQIRFEDNSIGWYEAGWGPMISDNAFFIKDVFGPKGAVSIVAKDAASSGMSDNVNAHTKTESIKIHSSEINNSNKFIHQDKWIDLSDEPTHDELCRREQTYFYRSIVENIDLNNHLEDALNSLKIALACDQSVRTGEIVYLV